MKTLIVSAVFPPETVVSSQTSAQLAEGLLADGHTVRVIAPFPNRPGGQLYPGHRRTLLRRNRREDGLHLTHCFTVISGESGMVSRFLENLSFGLSAGLAFLLEPKPDVIYANTWPTFATGILALLARLRGVPLVVSVQDIYPDQLIAQGRIAPTSAVARLMGWIERRIAATARGMILISPSLVGEYGKLRRVAPEKMHVIPNWADRDSITPDHPDGAGFRERYAIPPDAFVAVYGGNVAYAAGVETVVAGFGRFSPPLPDTHLLIAGEGAQLAACRQAAAQSGNPRIHFHTPWPRAENSMVLASADLLILPTRGTVSLAAMPSKLISYMLSGRPVLALALPESDLAHVIHDSGCGWVIPPDDPDQLAETVRTIRALPIAERRARGEAGRQYALTHLTREACVPRVIALLRESAGG